MSTREISRKELYELVWHKPMTHLASDLGFSDYSLPKICKKYNIPRPERGYWNKLAAGYGVTKTPLPKGSNPTINLDREGGAFCRQSNRQDTNNRRSTENELNDLIAKEQHWLADKVAGFFDTAATDQYGRLMIRRKTTPRIIASPKFKDTIVSFTSLLAHAIESNDIRLVSGTKDNGLQFEKGEDVLSLTIEEGLESYEVEPTLEQKRKPSWTWDIKRERLSGKLSIRITGKSIYGRCKWSESKTRSLLDQLSTVVGRMQSMFQHWEDQREENRKQNEEREEASKKRIEQKEYDKHCGIMGAELMRRQINLMRAAEQYKLAEDIKNFVVACVANWGGAHALSEDQQKWISYANQVANKLTPQADGYPDPIKDRAFDPAKVAIGGPYPIPAEEVPLPYSLLEIQGMLSNRRF